MSRAALKLAEEWRGKISTVARNLTEFNDSEAAARVRARLEDRTRPFKGRTADAAREATRALAGLWQDYLLVSEVVDEAWALAKRPAILGDRDAAVEVLLLGSSVRLPSLSIPVTRRGLLDPADTRAEARPQDVLASMIAAFETARNAVAAIAAAEDGILPRAARLREEADHMAAWARAVGYALDVDALATIEAASDDPLEAAARLDAAERMLDRIRDAKRVSDALVAALRPRFEAADARLAELVHVLACTRAALDECAAKIEEPVPARALEDAIAPQTWLRTLKATAATGHAKPASIGLERWEAAMTTTLTAARSTLASARAPLDRMADVKGRLRALRAKAGALGATDLEALVDEAKTAVAAVPFRHDEAKRLVDAFETALSAAVRDKVEPSATRTAAS